jgi:hypothetical protein
MRTGFFIALAAALWTAETARAVDAGSEAAKSYRIVTSDSTASLQVGQKGRLVLAVEPLVDKVHVNAQAPLRIALESTAGMKLEKDRLAHADATAGAASRFEVAFVALAPGRQEAKARLDFYICSDLWCVKQTRNVSIAVDVK